MRLSGIKNILIISSLVLLGACASGKTKQDQTDSVPAGESVPTVGSEGEAAPPSVDASGPLRDYTVQKGDTLMKIAFLSYGDVFKWKEIYENNKDKISDPNAIRSGIMLKVGSANIDNSGNGARYLIKKGETLGTISNTLYGTPSRWKELYQKNRDLIHNPNKIFAGFTISYALDPGMKPVEQAQSDAAPSGNAPISAVQSPDAGSAPEAAIPALAPATDQQAPLAPLPPQTPPADAAAGDPGSPPPPLQ